VKILILIVILIGSYYALALSIALIFLLIKYVNANYKSTIRFDIRLEKGTSPGNEYYYLLVKAPFYDEAKHFYLGFSLLKFSIAFVPVETIPAALKELLKEKYIYQVQWDSMIPHESPMLSETIKDGKVEVAEGLFIYSPESIKLDALRDLGFNDGRDIFFMTSQPIDRNKIQTYKKKLLEWDKLSPRDQMMEERRFFESEGELVKFLDTWQIIHRDEEFVRKAINLICEAVGRKAIRKAKLNTSFSIKTDLTQSFSFIGPTAIRAYTKNGQLVVKGVTAKKENGKWVPESITFTEQLY
jgi:hypothetical protein